LDNHQQLTSVPAGPTASGQLAAREPGGDNSVFVGETDGESYLLLVQIDDVYPVP